MTETVDPETPTSAPRRRRYLLYLALVALPVLAVVVGEWDRRAAGPYWLGSNSDPEYMYLHNGLSIAVGLPVFHVDNPGTPLQWLTAGVCVAGYHLVGDADESLELHVLRRPEQYLTAVNRLLLVLLAASLVGLGWTVWRRDGRPGLAVTAQFVLLPVALQQVELHRVRPELLLLSVGCWLCVVLLPRRGQHLGWRRSLLLGALVGMAVACKFTALPLALLVFAAPGWRDNLASVLAAPLSFLLCIKPAWPAWPRMVDWVLGLATTSGHYASGPEGLPGPLQWAKQGVLLLRGVPLIALGLALLAVALVAAWRALRVLPKTDDGQKPVSELRLVGLVSIILGLQFMMVAKHPGGHYLIPALALVPLLVVELARIARTFALRRARSLAVAGLALVAVAGVADVWSLYARHGSWIHHRRELAALDERLTKLVDPSCLTITYYRCSTPAAAQAFGNDYCGWAHHKTLAKLFPNGFDYPIIERQISRFGSGPLPIAGLQEALDRGQCFLLRGTPMSDTDREQLLVDVALIDGDGPEHVYRVLRVCPEALAEARARQAGSGQP